MKKSLILAGMLAVGYANAQEGNVGINTENPQATLDIVPSKTNLEGTTNEGLLIPRLTKARVVAIAADKLVEGTKVYVTDEVTAADTQFVGTGKGFYFYNSTKWVKQLDSDNDTNSELWAQRSNAGVTETYLKPADEKNTDLVAYLDNNGVRNWRLNFGNVQNTDLVYEGTTGRGFKIEESINGSFLSSDAFPKQRVQNGSDNFYFNNNHGVIRDSHASGINKPSYFGDESRVVARNVNSALGALYGSNASVDLFSNNTVDSILGGAMITSVGSNVDNFKPTVTNNIGGRLVARNYGTSTNMYGGIFYVRNFGNATHLRGIYATTDSQTTVNGANAAHTVNSVRGIHSFSNLNNNGTLKDAIVGVHNVVSVGNNTKFEGSANIRGIYNRLETRETEITNTAVNYASVFNTVGTTLARYESFADYPVIGANTKITDYVGIRLGSGAYDASSTITNYYGIQVASITKGTDKNFAIHTGAKGIVHIGDKLGVGTETPTQRIEVAGNTLTNGGFMSYVGSNEGGWIELANTTKTEGKEVNRWRLYNMTNKTEGSAQYTNGLHFWAYTADDTNLSSQMVLTDEGNLGIGFPSTPTVSRQTQEKLEVNGNIRAIGLEGTGNRNVYVDAAGVLRAGDTTSSGTTTLTGETGLVCNAENRGKMNFIPNDNGSDVFGICLRNQDGNYYWGYLVGGGNIFNGTGAFGSGL